jgi:hypothetical protein
MGRLQLDVLMTKGRDKVAESLSDILQMISSRRRSGLLSLERYNAGHFEEGEIYFEKGRAVQAFFAIQSGQEALATLSSWRNVYYSFTADVPVPATSPLSSGNISGEVPPYSTTEPLEKLRYTTGPVRKANDFTPTSPLRRASQSQPPTGPQPPMRQTSPQQFQSPGGGSARERATGSNPPSNSGNSWGFGALVPHRLSNEQNVLSLPLTRPQRSIYLLVDGVRTVADLVRCTGKVMQDVEQLLMELKQQGYIAFS